MVTDGGAAMRRFFLRGRLRPPAPVFFIAMAQLA